MKTKLIGIVLLVAIISCTLGSCATTTQVQFYTDVDGATLFIDGEMIGTTPLECSLSNAIWEDPDILITKEGYKDLRTSVKKELKPLNLVSGLVFLWVPLLWVYGPKEMQHYILTEDTK